MHFRAPASFNSWTIRRDVVPRTIESSTMTTRLPPDDAADRTQLHAHAAFTLFLGRLNEGPADIPVFDQTDFIRKTAGFAVADRGREAGIRHTDDDIRFDVIALGQKHPA